LKTNLSTPDTFKGVFSIAMSQFGLAFCFNVVMSFMPFYIIRVSTYTAQETMIWIGLIMGLNSFISALMAPVWGGLTAKFRPKALFQWAFFFNAIIFLIMGFTFNLPLILGLRLIQGALGGASTIGLFMISEISSQDRLGGNLSLYQNSMTAGQLLGPPVGAYLAAHLGYRSPFIFSFVLIGVCLLLCHIYVADLDKKESGPSRKILLNRGVLWGWVLILIATIHLNFLPSILPHILDGFGLIGESALKSAGFIMMGYTATAIVGSYTISRLTPRDKLAGVIAVVCLTAAFFQALLFFSQGVVSFTVIRMLQTGAIAAVLPLVMANFASGLGGTGIGFLNSARFAGMGVGPLLATTVLAGSSLLTLYMLISLLTVGAVLAFWITISLAPSIKGKR
jgi:MFS transporter, DHA1 family, multidrug resistance protein